MGKASKAARRKDRSTPTDASWASAAALPAKPVLLIAAAVGMIVLAAVPMGPFHAVPRAELWPLVALACLFILAGIPSAANRLPALFRRGIPGEVAGLFIIFSSWILLKLVGLHPSGTDDNIYFYFANRMSQGAMPYRDFFFAHPPVHLLVPAAVFKVAGFSIGAAKLIPVVAQTAAGVFLYLTLRRASVVMALIGLFAHFTAYQILMGSTDMNGENLMTMFLWASAWAAVAGRPLISGVAASAAIGCGMYALAGVIAIGVLAFSMGRRSGALFAAAFGATTTAWMVIFGIIGGSSFIDGVFLYHFRKPVGGEGRESIFGTANPFRMTGILVSNLGAFLKGDLFKKALYYHGAMFILTAVSGFAAWKRWRSDFVARRMPTPSEPHMPAAFGLLSTILFLLQWAAVNEMYDFYMVPMLSFMCPAVAFAAYTALKRLSAAASAKDLIVPAVVVCAAWAAVPAAISINAELWPEEQKVAGQTVSYEWRDPYILKGSSAITKALFFADSRKRGEVTPFYRHYMWNKSLTFSAVDEIAEYVRNNTSPEMTISGASTLAPLIALQAGRRIAGDEADTNGKRFKTGMLTDESYVKTICSDRIAFVVSASGSYFSTTRMGPEAAIGRHFRPDRTFTDTKLKHFAEFPITLYRSRNGSGCGAAER